MILSLDVSTSTIGISLFDENGKLERLTHISPTIKKKDIINEESLYIKSNLVKGFFSTDDWKFLNITDIVIEEPLIVSKVPITAAKLNKFAGMFYKVMREVYPTAQVSYITVNDSRKTVFPEYVEKRVLWRPVPKTIRKYKIKDYRKLLVWYNIAMKFPEIKWELTRNVTIDKKNFDKADSVVVGLAFLIKKGILEPRQIELYKVVSFLESYFSYIDEAKEIDKRKTFKSDVRKQMKFEVLRKIENLPELY